LEPGQQFDKNILNVLDTIYLKFRKPVVQRVTVVKLGVYSGGGNCFCGVKVKVGTDTAESTNDQTADQGFVWLQNILRILLLLF